MRVSQSLCKHSLLLDNKGNTIIYLDKAILQVTLSLSFGRISPYPSECTAILLKMPMFVLGSYLTKVLYQLVALVRCKSSELTYLHSFTELFHKGCLDPYVSE